MAGQGKLAIRRNDGAAKLGEEGQSYNNEGQGDREGAGLGIQNHHQ